ncbi:MAG TPA: NADH-quinone oxidoreductase subunit NuoG [Acidimicrobiales bacterium]|nr:NADH-quinone oxidoreductase subunit NuoG [Acidimicrobiales bacterium]
MSRPTPRPYLTESAVGTAPPTPSGQGTVSITIDGRQVQVRAGQWIIEAVQEAGVYIPRFCYHPRMKPVGMCRMCLVEVEGPRGATLMPACYNAVSDGMEIRTKSEKAVKAQEGVLEFLLVNHPLDCPVCDKGGECPLQDQTLAYGPGDTRFVEEKRHWDKPIPISELVLLDRERCIQCGRCVRFADEVSGDALIDFADRGDKTEVAVFPDEPYSSYFSGNVVQICPVGALTAKPYRFRARPWDLEQVESTCTACSFGCRAAVQSSSGEVSRLIGVDSDPVNWGWLCDKGRFANGAMARANRLSVPLVRRGDELVETSWAEALARAAEGIAAARRSGGGRSIGLIGGARLANEDAYVWSKFARMVLGTDNLDAQLGDGLPAETVLGLPRATIDEAAAAPLVITVGSDVKEELPVLYLRLRHGIRENSLKLVELVPAPTGLSPYAAETAVYRPGELAGLVAAIASGSPVTGDVAGVGREQIERIRAELDHADKMSVSSPAVVVVIGRPSLAESGEQVAAAARVLAERPGVAFMPALRRSNVHGALDLGLAPGILPGRVSLEEGRAWFEYHWGAPLPEGRGADTAGMLADASRGRIGALILLGADPLVDFPDSRAALRGVLGARFVVAVDTHLTESARKADVVLPAAAWAERRGTFTNVEGRVTWLGQLVPELGSSWPDWMIACELSARLGVNLAFTRLEDVWAEIERVSPLHHGIPYEVFTGVRARDGIVVPADPAAVLEPREIRPLDPMADPGIASAELHKVAPSALVVQSVAMTPEPGSVDPTEKVTYPQPPASGDDRDAPPMPTFLGLPPVPVPAAAAPPAEGLRLVARRTLWDGGTDIQESGMVAALAPSPAVRLNPAVLAELGAADGEKVVLRSARGSLVVEARADAGIPEGTAVLPWNLPGGRAADLIDSGAQVTSVVVEAAE